MVVAGLPPSWDVDDLVGPGDVALVEAAGKYDPSLGVPWAAYGRLCIYRACLGACRHRRYRASLHEPLPEQVASPDPDPEQAMLTREREAIWAEVWRIPTRHRMVIYLYYVAGEDQATIGRVLSIGRTRVCQLHREALEMLRAWLSPDNVHLSRVRKA